LSNSDHTKDIPEHLKGPPTLYVRVGERVAAAPQEDVEVARRYPSWPHKGPLKDGKRLTIMTKKVTYAVNEGVRVIHIAEVVKLGEMVYVMGPKPVYDEYVDGKLATGPLPEGGDPLVPNIYQGLTLPSPAADYNYEITAYRFSEPGTHQIQWKPGPLRSNVLTFKVQRHDR
jgi:hypothetical protein